MRVARYLPARHQPSHLAPRLPWHDNLGALFTHDGIAETVYSTSTVDVSAAGTTTLDYWAQIPGAAWLHATRDVVVERAANDNPQPQAAEQSPHDGNGISPSLQATGTDATSTP